jgi:2'-5' RNA ligase
VAAEAPRAGAKPSEPTRRLFFALGPDEPMRQAMAKAAHKAARASGGRPVPAENLHVTLAFLGSVPERQLPELAEIARVPAFAAAGASDRTDAAGAPLELVFDHLEYWRAAQLLCASPAEPPMEVAKLARTLQARLTQGGFAPDLKPFRPHVTVVRKVVRPGPLGRMHPVAWRFTELALIESRTLPEGALYSVVESFPLCGPRSAQITVKCPD